MTAIRLATPADAAFIASLMNHYIATSTCNYDVEPVDVESRRRWLAGLGPGHVATICEVDGRPAGYGSLGPFRAKAGYSRTVEHSVYVLPDLHRRGIGAAILDDLIARARALGHHAMIGAISADQQPSLDLHSRKGFREVGRLPQVARKFDRWLDLVIMELLLE
jgi:L-amino acid N-acyltransferase YncA